MIEPQRHIEAFLAFSVALCGLWGRILSGLWETTWPVSTHNYLTNLGFPFFNQPPIHIGYSGIFVPPIP
ncbi:MAG TPA: hypothetical protein PLB18_02735, partial [Acidobacteriota bacterium]|nr:hypothetical protein [Acidobacteriota bacterium]